MWVFHKGDRTVMYNIGAADKVTFNGNRITVIHELYGNTSALMYDNEEEAKQAFFYLLEAIKRKDTLVGI